MAYNVFKEHNSNYNIIKAFEEFCSNIGIWENEKPYYAKQIKYSKLY